MTITTKKHRVTLLSAVADLPARLPPFAMRHINTRLARLLPALRTFIFTSLLATPLVATAMTPISDAEMAGITGQALLVTDYIPPNSLAGADGTTSDFGFYRMGLDAKVSFNMNIDKLQLGCGGYNNALKVGCDIDIDYVRMMGNNGSGGPGDPVTSDFSMTRPYIALAIKNPDDPTKREVAGFKVGAQSANGYFGIGRRYQNGQVNQENGGTCNSGGSAAARAACHSGLNSVSGFLHTQLSGEIPVSITLLGTQTACFGNMQGNSACNNPYYIDIVGTRMDRINAPGVPLTLSGGFLSAIGISQAYATISESLRFIHGFALDNTQDFGLSFERQPISYPKYDKSGYSHVANTGWWMNIPNISVVNFHGDKISLGLGEAIDALSSPGPVVADAELNMMPPKNCYGSYKFC